MHLQFERSICSQRMLCSNCRLSIYIYIYMNQMSYFVGHGQEHEFLIIEGCGILMDLYTQKMHLSCWIMRILQVSMTFIFVHGETYLMIILYDWYKGVDQYCTFLVVFHNNKPTYFFLSKCVTPKTMFLVAAKFPTQATPWYIWT